VCQPSRPQLTAKRTLPGKPQGTYRKLPRLCTLCPGHASPHCILGQGPRVSSNYTQSEKLGKSSILPEGWAMHGIVWPGRFFEPRILDRGEGRLVEVEMFDVHNPLLESSDKDGMWKMTLTKITITARRTLAGRHWHGGGTIGACTKISKIVPGSIWMERVHGGSTEYLQRRRRQWEEEDCLVVRRRSIRWTSTGST